MKPLHIGYFADGPWGHGAFRNIMEDETLEMDFVCVRYGQPDKILSKMAKEKGIDVLCTPNVNSKEFLETLKGYPSELYVSMSFNQIFRKEIRGLPAMKIINCHAGKLPFYRGRNILNWVLINDEKEFGITVHYVDSGIDTGDILIQRTYEITDQDTYGTLLEKAYQECPDLLYQAIKQIQTGSAHPWKQDEVSTAGLYCRIRRENDEILDWNQTSREVFNFIRALTKPGPCACSYCREQRILFFSSALVPDAPVYKGIPGQVLVKQPGYLLVKTKDSYLKVTGYEGNVKVGDRMRTAVDAKYC